MKLQPSPKIIIASLLGTAIAFGVDSGKIVKGQMPLSSVPEIGWNTRLSSFELESQNVGQVFTFSCPMAVYQVYAPVWGTDTYTINSSLCQGAVHAGMITQEGGLINVKLMTKKSYYQGSERFGVKSQSYEGEVYSVSFIGNPITFQEEQTNTQAKPSQHRRRPSVIEKTVENGVRRGIERTISDSIRDIFR